MAFNKKKADSSIVELEPLQGKGTDKTSSISKNAGSRESSSSHNRTAEYRPYDKIPEFEKSFDKRLLNVVKSGKPSSVREYLTKVGNVNVAVDEDELTALHFATAKGDLKIVEELLQFKADPHAEDRFGRTPFHIAAAMCNAPCLTAMIKAGAKPKAKVNLKSSGDIVQSSREDNFISARASNIKIPMPVSDGSTALHEASRANSPKCIEILLKAGAKAEVIDKSGVTPLLLAGTGLKASQKEDIASYEQVVKLLLDAGANGNVNNDGMANSALLHAIVLGSLEALKLLMDAKADPEWSSKNGGGTTALHEAAGIGRVDMLEALICHKRYVKQSQTLANVADAVKRTPLHKAAYVGAQDCVRLLLKCGADSSLRTITGVSGIEAIILNIPDSKTFLSSLLDSCITCNIPAQENPAFAVTLDFSFLAPEVNDKQTALLNALLTSNAVPKEYKNTFLLHPLAEAFVRFKWSSLRGYFIFLVIVYTLYVFSLSIYVTLAYTSNDNPNDRQWFYDHLKIYRISTMIFATVILLIFVGQCFTHFRYYLRQPRTWIIGLSSITSVIWMVTEELSIKNEFQIINWVHHFVSISLPIAWAGLMLLLGHFPAWGSKALLFGVVLKNVIWTLFVLGCLIIGFSFSFFVQFHNVNSDAFGDPWKAICTTVAMMTGEYEFLNIFNSKENFLPVTSRVLFLIFIVVASIVLVNLTVGLAVTDTQSMKTESERRSLYKRAEFVGLLEYTVAPIAKLSAIKQKRTINLHGRWLETEKNIRILPIEVLNSLTQIALAQKRTKQDSDKTNCRSLPLQPPMTMEKTLQNKISQILEKFSGEVIQAVRE